MKLSLRQLTNDEVERLYLRSCNPVWQRVWRVCRRTMPSPEELGGELAVREARATARACGAYVVRPIGGLQ